MQKGKTMTADKAYCMSSFLAYRMIADSKKCFREDVKPVFFYPDYEREGVENSAELEAAIKRWMASFCADGKAALALSGGIDSAILAKYMPKGATAYTFRCTVPDTEVTNEVPQAAKYAKECGLNQKVIEITWEDMVNCAPLLMRRKGAPIHSIEVQIYKAALEAKKDGYTKLIFGESADCNYGGMSRLLSRDWSYKEFVQRFSYVLPEHVLRQPVDVFGVYKEYEKNGVIDVHRFLREFYFLESMGAYSNACEIAGIDFETPYAHTCLKGELDLGRIRAGESKYLIRELFRKLYPDFEIPEKTPMPRPVNEWLRTWRGPVREEFLPKCAKTLDGDQKWLLWSLECFLNMLDAEF